MTAALGHSDLSERPRRRRQLHGRRVGRALTGDAERLIADRLPALRLDLNAPPPAPLTGLFAGHVEEVWLEVGFGGGEHLLWQADAHRRVGFIGCEPFISGVAKLVRGVVDAGLQNVRLYDDDARHVLDWLPGRCIGRVFVLFPDPWPKQRHRKRRFLNEEGLASLSRVMRKGASLRFATDIADYATMVAAAMDKRADFVASAAGPSTHPIEGPVTRYAEKALAAGRQCQYFSFERV